MCGITGIYDTKRHYPIERKILISMADELAHRGPDDSSSYIDGNVGLGFRRLSIIDIENGQQPFFCENDSIILICNGEIYNYKELRLELEYKGYKFKTNCDVEVIMYLYLEYETDFLNKLNGQFAFAIVDKKTQRLFLARDHFGICPLFYTFFDGVLIFASEIKAILKHPLVKREVDMTGLDQIFTFPGLVSPTTMFKNILSLAPGHYLVITPEDLKVCQYWDLKYPEIGEIPARSESFYLETLEELLLKSVKYRLNADVPVGFYLSGGLDSSLIGGLMRAINPNINYPSFSIGFPLDTELNERNYQKQMVQHLSLENIEIAFDSLEIEKNLKKAVWASECALKESYNTCSLSLSKAVNRKGIKVILSGEGADELFGGYIGYRFDKQRKKQDEIKDIQEHLEDDYRRKLWGDSNFFYEKNYYEFDDLKLNLYSEGLRDRFKEFNCGKNLVFNKERIRNRHIFHKRSYIDLKLRLSDHLISDHCDRVTYANSVEGRFPFLDINLVEFIKTIPPDMKLKGLVEKHILKQLSRKYIPNKITNRQKFEFVSPGSPSLIKMNIEWINDLLSYDNIKKQGYFNPDIIEKLKKNYGSAGFKLNLPFESDLLIVVLTFNIFLELFKMPDIS